MSETIYGIRTSAEKDPYYANSPMRSLVILGAGHGGFTLEQGVHNEFAKRLKGTGLSTSLGIVSTYNQEIKAKTYQELLEKEAIILAQKTPAEIEAYELPPALKQLEQQLLKMRKK